MKNENTNIENFREEFIAAQFELDNLDKPLAGYTFKGDYWNGFGCPYFDFDTMRELAKAVSDGEHWNVTYDLESDKFHFENLNNWDDQYGQYVTQAIGATIINGMKLYQAHQLCWCFYAIDDATTVTPDAQTTKSFDVRTVYTEFLTITVQAASAELAEKLVESGLGFPEEYLQRLHALQSEFGIDFCDSEIEVMGSDENEN